jgi:hypothetical protein
MAPRCFSKAGREAARLVNRAVAANRRNPLSAVFLAPDVAEKRPAAAAMTQAPSRSSSADPAKVVQQSLPHVATSLPHSTTYLNGHSG